MINEDEIAQINNGLASHKYCIGLLDDRIAALEKKAKACDELLMRIELLGADRGWWKQPILPAQK